MQTYPVDRHLRTRVVRNPTFGPGDESIFFKCDITGNHELWEIEQPGQWPRQRTFTGRDLTFASWSPTGEEIAIGMDSEGDEHVQLHLLDAETEKLTQLTDEPDVIHQWGGWNSDGSQFAYAANRRHSAIFDVYTQGVEESHENSERVYEHDRASRIAAAGWGPEDERILLQEIHSNFNKDIHLIDLETGEPRLLTSGPDEEVRYRNALWGPDGESLYLITDQDYNWLYLARLDLSTGEIRPVVQTNANIRTMVFHRGLERLAYVKYDNGYSNVVVGDLVDETELKTVSTPDFPRGAAESLTMSPDGTKLATVYYTPSTKPDIYTLNIESGDIVKWTETNAPVPNDVYVTPEPVTYESFDGLDVPSLYTTPKDASDQPMPAMIHLHGGPERSNNPAFDPMRQFYVERGYVRLEPNFRGSSGYGKEYMRLDDVEKRPNAIKDVKAAADWLAEKDEVDEDRIVLHGASYGGFLVLRALTKWPERFAGGVAMAAIANFETYLENTGSWRRENREKEYGSLEEHGELLEDLSPIHEIEQLQSPLFLVHGRNDPRVPAEESEQIEARTADLDVPVETLFLEDAGHGLNSLDHQIEICERAVSFLDEHV